MKPTTILTIIVIVLLLACGLLAAAWLGFIEIPGIFDGRDIDPDDPDAPISSEYCGYSDMEILGMIELASGKTLNKQVGVGFVRSLDMVACGTDDATSTEILNDYRAKYFDYFIQLDETTTGPGWTSRTMTWTNSIDATNSTYAIMVSSTSGTAVKNAYNYNTVTIHSEGTAATYQAFILWILSS